MFTVSIFVMVQEIVGISKCCTAKNDMKVSTKQYSVDSMGISPIKLFLAPEFVQCSQLEALYFVLLAR